MSRQGGLLHSFVTKRLQVQSKQEPESFFSFSFSFFASEPYSELKATILEKVHTTQQELYFCENTFT